MPEAKPFDISKQLVWDAYHLAKLVPDAGFAFGPKPTSCDAAIYGFIANIYFYAIETPLRRELMAHANLIRHCLAVHSLLEQTPRGTGATK